MKRHKFLSFLAMNNFERPKPSVSFEVGEQVLQFKFNQSANGIQEKASVSGFFFIVGLCASLILCQFVP